MVLELLVQITGAMVLTALGAALGILHLAVQRPRKRSRS